MAESDGEEIAFLKFSGDDVPAGVIDAATAGSALIALDEGIRYFNESQSPQFARIQYSVPVRTTGGSWVAWILGMGTLGAGAFALSYLKTAGEKMAEKDFEDIGLKDVLSKSARAIQHIFRLIKHTKKDRGWESEQLEWRNNGDEVGIRNSEGEILFLPAEFLKWYANLPPRLVSRLTDGISIERTLSFGVKVNDEFEEVFISFEEKPYFSDSADLIVDDVLFPELEHGQEVHLEGKLTRGNESSNSVGFEFDGHILNCTPEEGSITRFKPALFLRCAIDATVTRLSKNSVVAERRPTLIIKRITPLENEPHQDLFGD